MCPPQSREPLKFHTIASRPWSREGVDLCSKLHLIASRPWRREGVDLCSKDNRHYLIAVNYFLDDWEVDYLSSRTAVQVIRLFVKQNSSSSYQQMKVAVQPLRIS